MERKRTLSRDRAQFPGGFSRSRSSRRVVAYGTSVSLAMARIDISGFCARSSRTCRRVLSSKRGRPTCFPSIRALAIPAFTRSDSRMPSWFASAASSPISASLKMDQRGYLNRMLRLALPFFVDATFCAQTLAQMRRHPKLAVWVRDSCLHEPHRRSSRDRSGSP